jgi:hypothetical protein
MMKNKSVLITLTLMAFSLATGANSLNQASLSNEDINKISSLGISVGMWSFAAVFGAPENIICKSSVKSIKEQLGELGITKLPKALSCRKIKYEDANKLIEDISGNLTSLKGKQASDFFRIRSYSITAAFYISGITNETDEMVKVAFVFAGKNNLQEAIKAAKNIGIPAEIIEEGSQLWKELSDLFPKENEPRVDSSPYNIRLFGWEKKAVDEATKIITR